jgi:hypothetical protein
MCCFSGPVERVEATNILARMVAPGRQLLVYEMRLAAQAEVAMILPIPVPARSGDDSVQFRSLEHYPELFEDLDILFRPPPSRGLPAQGATTVLGLAVHTVGAFEASFVPTLADFARLDPRFRIPPGTIDRVPAYADWGFAVFQLAPTKALAEVHPMAFDFPTRAPDRLFFPTVHVHDGQLHDHAEFAHQLYAQGDGEITTWTEGTTPRRFQHKRGAHELLDLRAIMYRRSIFGTHPNTDVWASLS